MDQLGYKAYPMPKTPNFVGLLSQASAQGAKYIVIQNVSSPAAQVAKDIKAGNLDMKIVCLNWCADELFVKTAGAENAEGHVMVQPFAPASANKEGSKAIEEYLKSKGSSLDAKGLHYAQGWYTMDVMAKGIGGLAGGAKLTGGRSRLSVDGRGGHRRRRRHRRRIQRTPPCPPDLASTSRGGKFVGSRRPVNGTSQDAWGADSCGRPAAKTRQHGDLLTLNNIGSSTTTSSSCCDGMSVAV
jgi:hypothetical protein